MSQLGITQAFHRRLRAQEREVTRLLTQRYVQLREDLTADLDALTAQIQRELDAGREPSISWLQKQARYERLVSEIEEEVGRIARGLDAATDRLRSVAVELGSEYAQQMGLDAGARNMIRLTNVEAQDLIARGQADTAYRQALARLSEDAAATVERALMHAVVVGQNPEVVARRITHRIGGNMANARRIARTEVMQSYRNAALLNYQKNARLFEGWIWTAAIFNVPGPCERCRANHGKLFPLSQPMTSHPYCRCSPAPKLRRAPSTIAAETAQLEIAAGT